MHFKLNTVFTILTIRIKLHRIVRISWKFKSSLESMPSANALLCRRYADSSIQICLQDGGMGGKDDPSLSVDGQQFTAKSLSRICPSLKGAALPELTASPCRRTKAWPLDSVWTALKGPFSCRQPQSWDQLKLLGRLQKVQCFLRPVLFLPGVDLRTAFLRANMHLQKSHRQDTKIRNRYRGKRRVISVSESKGRHDIPPGEGGGLYPLSTIYWVSNSPAVMGPPSL